MKMLQLLYSVSTIFAIVLLHDSGLHQCCSHSFPAVVIIEKEMVGHNIHSHLHYNLSICSYCYCCICRCFGIAMNWRYIVMSPFLVMCLLFINIDAWHVRLWAQTFVVLLLLPLHSPSFWHHDESEIHCNPSIFINVPDID